MSQNHDKDKIADTSNFIVSLNGSQVWTDNKFDDEILEDIRTNTSLKKISDGDNEEFNTR